MVKNDMYAVSLGYVGTGSLKLHFYIFIKSS